MGPQDIHIRLPARCVCLAALVQMAGILLIIGHSQNVHAAIFACQSGEAVVYQDRPCPQQKSTASTKKSAYHFPLGMHESWFDLPPQAEDRAFCDRRGCECGQIERKHHDSLIRSVADALYLDGSWHRYEMAVDAWMESTGPTSANYDLRAQVLESACEIMMSQVLLRNYAQSSLQALKKRAQTAEERGFDVELPCAQGIEQACSYYESVQLLNRLRRDAAALSRERVDETLAESDVLSSSD